MRPWGYATVGLCTEDRRPLFVAIGLSRTYDRTKQNQPYRRRIQTRRHDPSVLATTTWVAVAANRLLLFAGIKMDRHDLGLGNS